MLINKKSEAAPELVNPETFVTLYLRHATVGAMERARKIRAEYIRQDPWNDADPEWWFASMMGAVYEAGRMQGKREERERFYERSLSQI